MGSIPSPELAKARMALHNLIDKPWKEGRIARGKLYAAISEKLGYEYHTAQVNTIKQARHVFRVARSVINGI